MTGAVETPVGGAASTAPLELTLERLPRPVEPHPRVVRSNPRLGGHLRHAALLETPLPQQLGVLGLERAQQLSHAGTDGPLQLRVRPHLGGLPGLALQRAPLRRLPPVVIDQRMA